MAEGGADAAIAAADALADELAEGADEGDPLVAWVDEQASRVAAAAHLAEVAARVAAYGAALAQTGDGGRPADVAVQARAAAAGGQLAGAERALAALPRRGRARELLEDALQKERRGARRDDARRGGRDGKRRGPERRG